NSMLITNDQGELEWATMESIVTANETVTTLVDNKDGTFTYYNEKDIDEDGEPLADAEGVSFDVTQSGAGDPNGNNTTGKAGDVYVDESTDDIYTHNGDKWNRQSGDIIVGGGNPNDNGTTNDDGSDYIDSTTGDTYIYNETTDKWEVQGKDLIAWGFDADPELDESTIEIVEGGENAVLVETSIRVREESITTNHIQNGTIQPEDIAYADKNQVLGTDEDGKPVWKKEAPRFFYMPAVIFNTKNTGTGLTRDLYQDYVNQFQGVNPYDIAHGANNAGANETSMPYDGGIISSDASKPTIEVYESDELIYYVTYYDTEVFKIHGISPEGILEYDIIGNATPSAYMNIVFVIK